ncbi:hypothetical protein EXU30_13205 [Shewanella maritima]|uniref:Outer membrane cytochrome MtrC/MtrF-like domain-containing protein n=1 Tax=Shewanella maritima TaxID=2520507 RepID=A0A411PJE3_9GAMM|nr:hypothetical protein [Shewanella maritima]QBF83542.1 hypothetical protein EXU30_13205 [Shewanella maritima]
MREFNKCKVAFVIASAMAIVGCSGEDGKDGITPPPPSSGTSLETSINMISHSLDEGMATFEFEVTNEDDKLVSGLQKANVEIAELTEKGIARSRDDFEGERAGGNASESTAGASLTEIETGRYEFIAPMENINAATEGIIRLAVGGSEAIAKSRYTIVAKSENVHTTTTETCQGCHVDFHASDIKHSSYTAINADGETDLVAGCLVCHNNVERDHGGYARNTMQKLGHINHQKFEKDFTPTNCYTCHAEPVINTSIAGNGCSDCHTSEVSDNAMAMMASGEFDAREFHAKSLHIGLDERITIRAEHTTELSAIYMNIEGEYCTDLSLFKGEELLDIEALYADGTLSYASTYIHGYHNESLVGRESRTYNESYKGDGTKTFCHPVLDLNTPQIMASSRLTFKGGNWVDEDGKHGVSFTAYSPVSSLSDLGNVMDYDRRHSVTADSCTTCHNNETNYHKNGSYAEGGLDCVACHNNGQDRSAKNSAPGFGPMIHSMHWGVGSSAVTGEPNSATELAAENCVACHADGIELEAIPDQYIRAKAFHNGDNTKMASPIMANCVACHDSAQAINHMEQNGGEIDAEVTPDWYTQPTGESCVTCHAEGKSFGIDKFHVFDRD